MMLETRVIGLMEQLSKKKYNKAPKFCGKDVAHLRTFRTVTIHTVVQLCIFKGMKSLSPDEQVNHIGCGHR